MKATGAAPLYALLDARLGTAPKDALVKALYSSCAGDDWFEQFAGTNLYAAAIEAEKAYRLSLSDIAARRNASAAETNTKLAAARETENIRRQELQAAREVREAVETAANNAHNAFWQEQDAATGAYMRAREALGLKLLDIKQSNGG